MATFLDRENSNYGGQPIALYEFRRGGTEHFYASCDHDIIASGNLYVATPISDEGVNQKGTAVTDAFEMTVPDDMTVAQWFVNTPPSDIIYVVIRRYHYGDSQAVIIWLGQVVSVTFGNENTAKITAQAVSISLRRGGLRLSWQRGCPHALYDQNCRVDKAAYAVSGTITAMDINSITVTPGTGQAFDVNAYWPGGIIEWMIGPNITEKRLIEDVASVSSGRFFPFGFNDGFSIGLAVTIYPGCKRVSSWCDGYFRNIENYGGFPWMPTKSPYDGDPVF